MGFLEGDPVGRWVGLPVGRLEGRAVGRPSGGLTTGASPPLNRSPLFSETAQGGGTGRYTVEKRQDLQ